MRKLICLFLLALPVAAATNMPIRYSTLPNGVGVGDLDKVREQGQLLAPVTAYGVEGKPLPLTALARLGARSRRLQRRELQLEFRRSFKRGD